MVTEDEVYSALRRVSDPEVGVNVVELGLIYHLEVHGDRVGVTMTLTTPGCPMHRTIAQLVESALLALPGVGQVEVRFVWEPRWTPERLSPAARKRLGFA